jgi:hypothetical protein
MKKVVQRIRRAARWFAAGVARAAEQAESVTVTVGPLTAVLRTPAPAPSACRCTTGGATRACLVHGSLGPSQIQPR